MADQVLTPEEVRERIEHRDALLDIRAVIATVAGRRFFKYLFKNLEVGQLPQIGLEGSILYDKLGFLRAGNSIFQLAAEADALATSQIIAENERERYEKLYAENGSGG